MATSIGPMFGILATAPREWNAPSLCGAHQIVLKSSQGQAFVAEVYSKNLRESLESGGERWIFVAQVIKEDGEAYYLFDTPVERALFCELREIDSIGSKYAATAVSELGVAGLARLARGESLGVSKIPGLGPKTLEKIQVGLKARRDRILPLVSQFRAAGESAGSTSQVPAVLMGALSGMGLRPVDVMRIFGELCQSNEGFSAQPTGEQLKMMLQKWGQEKNRKNNSSAERSL